MNTFIDHFGVRLLDPPEGLYEEILLFVGLDRVLKIEEGIEVKPLTGDQREAVINFANLYSHDLKFFKYQMRGERKLDTWVISTRRNRQNLVGYLRQHHADTFREPSDPTLEWISWEDRMARDNQA